MGNIWKAVYNPDKSICLGHRYEEEATIIEIVPTRVCNERVWSFIQMLFIAQFMTILAFTETFVFPVVPVTSLAFSVGVLSTSNGEYVQTIMVLHKLYCVLTIAYSILFRDICMLVISATYLVTYTVYFISLIFA